jgi:hypothetical protein
MCSFHSSLPATDDYDGHLVFRGILFALAFEAGVACLSRMGGDMTKKEFARYRAIILELSDLSRNGWSNALPSDYAPLEAEFRALAGRRR